MSTPSITAGQVLGHYRLIEKVGGGGQGEVYRAHDERFDRDVALKILPFKLLPDDAARKRFRKEALAVGKLTHPNIATAYYFGEENAVDFLVTEYVAGVGLDDKLAQGAIPEETVVKLGIQLASGLDAAHREGIVHRDLKPGNLRITQDGHLKILDFGLAELVGSANDVASVETVTINLTLTGTVPYMAPEQFGGICDQRTDLWAAGAVLYEMATGQLPFPETHVQKLKDAILTQEPARPSTINPNISHDLERVILRSLKKDPNRRYQTAADLREDLIRIARGKRVKSESQFHRNALRTAATVVLAGILGFATYHFWPKLRTGGGSELTFRVLAVLPVDSASEDAAETALGRGVAETVSARIAQETNGQKLQLIPPSELLARSAKTTDAARREFGVERVLEVAVQRSGSQVRVTCSLIDSRTHQVLQACTVTGSGDDWFAVQDRLVGEVVAMLPQEFRSEQAEPNAVEAAAPPGYEFYLKGKGYLLDYQKPENIDAAIREFEHALRVNPNYAPAYAGLGEAYWQGYKADRGKDWIGKAEVNCEKALSADAKLAESHTCMGNVYRSRGEYDKALHEIQQAIARDPNDVLTVLALGDTYDKLNKYSDAEATFKQAVGLRPNYWAAYNWAGFFYYGRANYPAAEEMFRKASGLAPGNPMVLENLGNMHLLQGRYKEAIEAFQRSLALRPTMAAYSDLGAAYYYLRRYPEAISAFEKARGLDDHDYLNWGNLGDALYWSPQRGSEASAAYRRAIELAKEKVQVNPKDATARAYIAEYSAMIGDRAEASTQLSKALEFGSSDPDVMFRAALVHNQFGEKRTTLDWLKQAVDAHFSPSTVRDTPDFAHLQSDPEFKAIISGK
jgi:serine/threonine protein kinase/tetratricopeptide (TPR) repeat protein